MSRYLLDTNHVSALLRGTHSLKDKLAIADNAQFALCIPSVGELYYMVFNSARASENQSLLDALLQGFEILPYDMKASVEFGKLLVEQRRMGKPIPSIDAQIAAVARVHHCILLTVDSHFQSVSNLSQENWLDS